MLLNVRKLDLEGRKPITTIRDHEMRGYSLRDPLDALAIGAMWDGLPADIHNRLSRTYPPRFGGFLAPPDIAINMSRDLLATTATGTAKGAYVTTEDVWPVVRPELANTPMCVRAGAQVLDGLTQTAGVWIPTLASGAAATWTAENTGNAPAMQFGRVHLVPCDLVATITISRRLSKMSAVPLEQMLRAHLGRQFARAIDAAALGTSASLTPTGIRGTSAVGSVAIGTSGGALTRAACWLAAEKALVSGELIAGRALTWAINGKTARHAAGIADGGGFLFEPNETDATSGVLADIPAFVAGSLPSTLSKGASSGTLSAAVVGDFAALVIGNFSPLEFVRDPYVNAGTGSTRITAFWSVGIAVLEPSAFCVISDIATG